MSPTRRRQIVPTLQQRFRVSQRRACRVVGQPRTTQRYQPQLRDEEQRIVQSMHTHVRSHPRFGYRRIWALLRREGFRINRKKVWRLWKREGFKVPIRRRKKRRLGGSENGILKRKAEHRNDVWTWDFIHDRDASGRPLKWLSVVDEYTRECVALEVERGLNSARVLEVIQTAMAQRGAARFIRSDNGPEFIARELRRHLQLARVETLYIAPGSPWENGFAESFHSRLRDELLNVEWFVDLREAKLLGRAWRRAYNEDRPHSSLGYRTPAAFAAEEAERRDLRCDDDGRSLGALPPNPRLLSRSGEHLGEDLGGANVDEIVDNRGRTLIAIGT